MQVNSNDEINFFDILNKIFSSKKIILITSLCFFIIGIGVALLSPIKYTSSTTFITQNQDNKASTFSGVASLVGINLGNSNFGGEVSTILYPQILESLKFKRLLLAEIIDNKKNLSLKKFITDYYEIEVDNEIIESNLIISDEEEICFEIINDILEINVNVQEGFTVISATMPNPIYSAIVSEKAKDILQKIVIENKIESAKQNLIFSEKQLAEKRLLFDEIQAKLAMFSDSNINSINSFVINEKSKLQAEFEIINAVVTELSKQVEQAKLQVNKDTPVFLTIKEAISPNKRSSPQRKQIVIIYSFIGFFLSILYILSQNLIDKTISLYRNS